MSVSVTLTVTPAAPDHGDTVTATYTVTGNDPVAPAQATVSGSATIGADEFSVTTTVTLPGTAALPESFDIPTCPGLTFTSTAQSNVFTAVAP